MAETWDQNSKVFFRKINSTRVKQRVFQITNINGETLTNQQEVIQEFVSYFQTLLGGNSPHRTVDLGFLQHEIRQITTAEASLLVAPVTAHEVKEAFFEIDVESAPGPDGFGSAFYRAAWPVIGQSMVVAVDRSLAAMFYKAITKIMVKRIQRVLPLLINYSQNAFVPGRSIADNILLAQELLAGYNQARLPERCTLKVDIQKAYDSVEWDFLLEGGRGLRQGDPISPYLFVLVMEIGSALLRYRIHNAPNFQYHWKCKDLGIINLCFADDVLLFCKADIPSIKILTDTLSEFATFSGLKVNPAKSQIILSRAVQQQRQQLLDCVGFQEGSLPIKYLGVLKLLERKMNFPLARTIGRGTSKGSMGSDLQTESGRGLGLRSLIIMNQALILKQLWRILQNDGSSIWVDWIQQNRLRHSTIWTFNRSTGSWCWKKLLKLRPILHRGVHYKVGDGSFFSLWQDPWHERGPLCLSFPRGIEVTGLPLSSTLSSVLQRNQWCWPAATDSDIVEIISMLPPTTPSAVDTICWRSNSGKFTLTSAVLLIQPPSPHAHWQGLLQGKFKIPRHGFILWLAFLEKLSTMDKPWYQGRKMAVFYVEDRLVTHDHLFFKCWFSKRCLTILNHKVKFQWPYFGMAKGHYVGKQTSAR
ncbi:UNVERIFIED_CONTAM: hypothetical protein Sradi_6927900 [Sesamum radiatum]|uniref:Reverse transcriptase domain-containing protein n=1 Tax=Sesamum radiatum TaxID=300843 RepID=A0AAW2JGI7_SESRA